MLAKRCVTGSARLNGTTVYRRVFAKTTSIVPQEASKVANISAHRYFTPSIYTASTAGFRSFSTGDSSNPKNFSSVATAPLNPTDVFADEAEIVRRVKAQLLEVDSNHDGKIDSEELKSILRRVGGFSDKEVFELGELFYAARGGAAATHEDFLKGVAQVLHEKEDARGDESTESEMSNATDHRKALKKNHPLGLGTCSTEFMFGKQRGVYTSDELDIKLTHVPPKTLVDKMAFGAVKVVRFLFDTVSLWNFGEITQAKVMRRVIFLETVAAIPGFVAAMVRHFRSLRLMTRDGGMLNMFLDEANNERMHLLSFVKMRDPGIPFRVMVMVSQTVVGVGFFVLYHLSPAFCHRFVGYIEEEACSTYTKIIKTIEDAPEGAEMAKWRTQLAPAIGRAYWHLGGEGTVLDMMYAIRADEAEHRDVNHVCSGMKEGQLNPLYNPQEKFDQMLLKYVKQMMERGDK